MHHKLFGGWAPLGPAGELTAFQGLSTWTQGKGMVQEEGRGGRDEGKRGWGDKGKNILTERENEGTSVLYQ